MIEMERNKFLVVITAPSGAGKTTVIKKLRECDPALGYSISATTRKRREGERDGVDYFYLSDDEFKARLAKDEFAEWATVHGALYGTLKSQIGDTLDSGSHVLMDIDVQGAEQLKKSYPDGVFIFLMPPDMDTLKSRLMNRSTEDEESLRLRLHNAVREIGCLGSFDYLVVNDDLEKCVGRISSIIHAESLKIKRTAAPDAIAARFLDSAERIEQ